PRNIPTVCRDTTAPTPDPTPEDCLARSLFPARPAPPHNTAARPLTSSRPAPGDVASAMLVDVGASTIEALFVGSSATMVFDDGSERTAGSLWEDGRRVAAWLRSAGVRRGDRVAVRLPNGPDYVRLLAACAAGGFVLVSVNT